MKLTKYDRQAIVRAIMQDVPKPDKIKRKDAIQAAIIKAMSPEVRKVYNKTPLALRTQYFGSFINDYGHRELIVGDVSDDTIKEITKPFKDEEDARISAEYNLNNAVNACTTLKMLETRLPEFKKYFPTVEAPTKNLPALANVVAGLSKLGWPKGEKG
jgi:UDP-N-acetylmuramyl tripeptide synthase